MKATGAGRLEKPRKSAGRKTKTNGVGRIHPVVIYPFHQPVEGLHLKELYQLIARLDRERGVYARPITVIDRKTHGANATNKQYREFRSKAVARHSDILDTWGVDTCQTWYAGLGQAFERGGPGDVLVDPR